MGGSNGVDTDVCNFGYPSLTTATSLKSQILSLLKPGHWIGIYSNQKDIEYIPPARGGGTLGISGWGCAAGSLEPLTFTRASSAEFCYPRVNCLKTIPFTAAHTYIAHIWQYPPPPREYISASICWFSHD